MTEEENNPTSISLNNLCDSNELIELTTSCHQRKVSAIKKVTGINISFNDISYSVNSWPINKLPARLGK